MSDTQYNMLEWALRYGDLGIEIIPVHTIRNGKCSCGDSSCRTPAKHPIPRKGLSAATSDPDIIRSWWAKYPDANIGAHMARSGWLGIDIDEYHSDHEKLLSLQENLGVEFPETVSDISGSHQGGKLYYKHPGGKLRGVLAGVVLRNEAFCILAPSLHVSGNRYEWLTGLSPWEYKLAELPAPIIDMMRPAITTGQAGIPEAEADWLVNIPQSRRIADLRKYLHEVKGEIKGESLPGYSFNIMRGVRKFAVHDQEIVLSAVQEIYDPKCVPPWEERIGRLVWNAYERAYSPQWGEHYLPEEERLADLGYDPKVVTQVEVAPPPVPAKPSTSLELIATLEAARTKLSRSTNIQKKLASKYLTRVLRHQRLTDKPEEEVDALKGTLRALAKYAPSEASDVSIVEVLAGSVPGIETDTLLKMVSKYRAAEPPKDAAQQGELPPPKDDDELRGQLVPGREEGTVKNSPDNIARILKYSQETKDKIKFNELTKEIEVWSNRFEGLETNIVDIEIRNWLSSHWGIAASREEVDQQLQLIARRDGKFDPVADYLRGLTWDGIRRLDTWLIDYCGAEDTNYNRRVGAMWMIAACARGITPGCKVDNVLVLEGGQGVRKSTTFAVLGGEWFSGTPLVIGNKDSYQIATSKWIIELAELSSLRMGEVEAHKAFLSTATDTFRPPYGKVPENCARHCIFGGSTNEYEYLQDGTGNRRYWAVRVGSEINIAALTADRDQLWAEATYRYLSASENPQYSHPDCPGERWWFTPAEETEASEIIARRKIEDPYVTLIKDWTHRKGSAGPGLTSGRAAFGLVEVGKHALDLDPKEIHKQTRHIVRALREAGFEPVDGDTSMWRKAGTEAKVVYTNDNTPVVNTGSQTDETETGN